MHQLMCKLSTRFSLSQMSDRDDRNHQSWSSFLVEPSVSPSLPLYHSLGTRETSIRASLTARIDLRPDLNRHHPAAAVVIMRLGTVIGHIAIQ